MGRTVPTFRQLVDDAIARWAKFRRALRREDQEYFDRLFRRVRSYTQAATYQANDNPMEAILLSIALDQEKRLDALERAALPPITGAGSALTLNASGEAWSPPEPGAGSTWSPPEKSPEQLDAPRSPDENEQPDTQPDAQLTRNPIRNLAQTGNSTSISGCLLDLYPSPHGMTLWLIGPNQTRHRLIDRFTPAFYVSGPDAVLRRLRGEAARQPHALACRAAERMDLWEQRARPVLEIEVAHPNEFASWTRWVRQFDSALRLYNSDLMLASLYCWQRGVFPLARVEVEADGEGRVLALECRDTEWAIDYELPPLEILRVRLGGLKGIIPGMVPLLDNGPLSKSRWTDASSNSTKRASPLPRVSASARAARPRPDPERLGRCHDPACL